MFRKQNLDNSIPLQVIFHLNVLNMHALCC